MSKIFNISKQRDYPVVIENDFRSILNHIKFINYNAKIAIITDKNVNKLHLPKLVNVLKEYFKENNIYVFKLENGEKAKNFKNVHDIYKLLLHNYFDRSDAIFAFGGGVIGDTAGFIAATFLRGLPFIQVPSTLLAQVDSSIGGKVGVNYYNLKNVIGSFYQPKLVYTNIELLKTLPINEMRNGITETIVHSLIAKPEMLDYILKYYSEIITARNINYLEYLVYENIKIKLSFVEKDEKESGLRRILNFGHTIGHAVEAFFDYKYSHGECVSIGIIAAFKIGVAKKLIDREKVNYIISILNLLGLPIYIENINWELIMDNLRHDKKVENGTLNFILPTEVGKVRQYKISIDNDLKSIISDTQYESKLFMEKNNIKGKFIV